MRRLVLAAIVPLIASFGIALTPAISASATPNCAGTSLRNGLFTGLPMRVPTVGNGTPNQFDCILGPGDNSTAVARLQIDLNFCFLPSSQQLKVDGIYGPKTMAAVEMEQQVEGVSADGIYGPQTIRGNKFAFAYKLQDGSGCDGIF